MIFEVIWEALGGFWAQKGYFEGLILCYQMPPDDFVRDRGVHDGSKVSSADRGKCLGLLEMHFWMIFII